MVRRLLLDAVLRRRERRQRQGDLRRFGQLHERRRHRHQYRFLPFYVPRQHLLQDHQEPYGRYDLRLLGDQRQRDPFERHRQLLDDSGPRHVHARHPPRLPRRRPARSGYQQYDHLGGMVRPLLYQQLCDPPLHGQLQPQVGHCRRPVGFRPDRQPQLLQEQLPVSGRQRHQPDPPDLRRVVADQPPEFSGARRLQQILRRPQSQRHGRIRLPQAQDQRHVDDRAGRRVRQDPDAGGGHHAYRMDRHPDAVVPDLLFRTSELQLQGEIHAGLHHARRRFVALRQG